MTGAQSPVYLTYTRNVMEAPTMSDSTDLPGVTAPATSPEEVADTEETSIKELCRKVFLAAFDTAVKMPGLTAEMAWEGWVEYIESTDGDIWS